MDVGNWGIESRSVDAAWIATLPLVSEAQSSELIQNRRPVLQVAADPIGLALCFKNVSIM